MTEQAEKKLVQLRALFLDYEIRTCWWAGWIFWKPIEELTVWYFVWKVRRKFARYLANQAKPDRACNEAGRVL